MSNNLIRKGLAIVASASLALAGVVGISSAANAAPSSLVIESSFGATSAIQTSKTQNGVLGYEFNLYVQAPGVATSDRVRYLVESADITTASVTVTSRWVPTLATAVSTSDSDTVYRASGSTVGNDPVPHTIEAAGSSNALVITPSYTASRVNELHQFTVNLSATYAATKTVTITPFVDSIDNKVIDSAELKGTPIVITLHKPSEVTFTSQLVAPTTSSQVLRADVTANKDVNIAQWRTVSSSPVRNQFYVNGTKTSDSDLLVAWSGDVARSDTTGAVSIAAGAVVSVQQSIAGGAYAASGTTGTVTAGNIATVGAVTDVSGFTDGSNNVRVGDGNLTVKSETTVKTGAAKAGQTVTFKIEENAVNSLATAASVNAGGKSLTNSSATTVQSITVDVLTDADGVATLPITYTGLVAANAFKITASAVSAAGGVVSSAAVTKTATASVANALVDLAKISATAVRSVVAGGNVSIQYRVVDQFGQTPVGNFRAVVALGNKTSSNNAVYNAVLPITAGAFTVSFADNTTGASATSSSYSVDVTIEKQDATALTWSTTGGLAINSTAVVAVRSAAQAAATLTLAANDTTDVARDKVAFSSVDTRVTKSSAVVPAVSNSNGADLNGTVLGSNGTLQAGVAVTLSAPGLLFEQNGVYSVGSITVHTSADGAWGGVQVFSNKTGNQTITATSGSATKTLVVEFAATAYADGDTLTISAPKSIKSGRTLTMSVALVDEFGNGVSADASRLKVTYSGPGFEIRDPAAAELAAKTGVYTLRVLLGAGDTGVAAITASFNADTIATGAAVDTITASAATWVGPIANAKAGAKAGRVIVEAYRAKGKTVSVFVGSTRVASFVADKANFSAVVRGVKSGTRNVSVRLSGPGEDFRGAITVK